MQQHPTAWMVETAYRYLKAARHMQRGFDMGDVAQINAAIGVEILLKSFCSKPSGNHGEVNETYELDSDAVKAAHLHLQSCGKVVRAGKSPDKHDMLTLFYSVPADIRRHLELDQYEEHIERYRHIFTKARYPYERGASNDVDHILVQVLGEMIDRVNAWYGEQGWQSTYLYFDGVHPDSTELHGEELSYEDATQGY